MDIHALVTVGRVNTKVDRDVGNSLVFSSDTIRLVLDFLANGVKVGEHASPAVDELRIL